MKHGDNATMLLNDYISFNTQRLLVINKFILQSFLRLHKNIIKLVFFLQISSLGSLIVQADDFSPATNLQQDASISNYSQIPMILFYSASYCKYCDDIKAEFLVHMARDMKLRDKAIFREIKIDSEDFLIDFFGTFTSHKVFSQKRSIAFVPTLEFVNFRGELLEQSLIGSMVMDFYGEYVERGIHNSIKKLQHN